MKWSSFSTVFYRNSGDLKNDAFRLDDADSLLKESFFSVERCSFCEAKGGWSEDAAGTITLQVQFCIKKDEFCIIVDDFEFINDDCSAGVCLNFDCLSIEK